MRNAISSLLRIFEFLHLKERLMVLRLHLRVLRGSSFDGFFSLALTVLVQLVVLYNHLTSFFLYLVKELLGMTTDLR